jgi:hypothetical protein
LEEPALKSERTSSIINLTVEKRILKISRKGGEVMIRSKIKFLQKMTAVGMHKPVTITLILAVMIALTGCASMFPKADSISPIAGRLAELRVSQPPPVWNSVIHAHEVDFLKPVGDDKVLVGTLGKPSDTFSVSHLEFMLLDSKTGKKI